jgi:hypothetical protein
MVETQIDSYDEFLYMAAFVLYFALSWIDYPNRKLPPTIDDMRCFPINKY